MQYLKQFWEFTLAYQHMGTITMKYFRIMSDDVFHYPENCGIHIEGKGRQQQHISEEPNSPSLATVPPQSFSSLHSFPSQGWEHFVAPHGEIDIYIHCTPPSTGEKKRQIITADPTHS